MPPLSSMPLHIAQAASQTASGSDPAFHQFYRDGGMLWIPTLSHSTPQQLLWCHGKGPRLALPLCFCRHWQIAMRKLFRQEFFPEAVFPPAGFLLVKSPCLGTACSYTADLGSHQNIVPTATSTRTVQEIFHINISFHLLSHTLKMSITALSNSLV